MMYDEDFLDCDAFKAWAGDAVIIDADSLCDVNFSTPQSFVIKVYHGTTHDFNAFDLSMANCEGQYGKVHYFTTCSYDAKRNYACVGPDLDIRINRDSERMTERIIEEEDVDYEEAEKIAKERILKSLVGDKPRVLECVVQFSNPYVVGANNWLMTCLMPDMEALEQEEDEDDDAFEERLNARQDEAYDELSQKLHDAFYKAGNDLSLYYTPSLPDSLCLYEFGGLSEDFEKILSECEDILDLTDEDGNNLSYHFRARVIYHLGYDAIILLDAQERFHSMGMNSNTAHIHLFEATGERVKSTSSRLFDKHDCNINA